MQVCIDSEDCTCQKLVSAMVECQNHCILHRGHTVLSVDRPAVCCRSGSVISLAEPREEFVVKKLAKRLDIEIPLQEVTHGGFRAPYNATKEDEVGQSNVTVQAR